MPTIKGQDYECSIVASDASRSHLTPVLQLFPLTTRSCKIAHRIGLEILTKGGSLASMLIREFTYRTLGAGVGHKFTGISEEDGIR